MTALVELPAATVHHVVRAPSPPTDTPLAGCAVMVCTRNRPQVLRRFLDSLAEQHPVGQLIIVDASDDDDTERLVLSRAAAAGAAGVTRYVRVPVAASGVTRQRNLALALVEHDLVASFDDDIVLRPGCLAAMEAVHRHHRDVVGVAACIENEPGRLGVQWQLRRLLGLVPAMPPGRYYPSGVSTPWRPFPPDAPIVAGDWLPGGAVMWKTPAARAVGYARAMDGYGSANDLEFSLRMRAHGRQVMAPAARVLHLQAASSRPAPERLAFEFVRNRRHIHRLTADTGVAGQLWFTYAMTVEILLQALTLGRAGGVRSLAASLRGAVAGLREPLAADRTDPVAGLEAGSGAPSS